MDLTITDKCICIWIVSVVKRDFLENNNRALADA